MNETQVETWSFPLFNPNSKEPSPQLIQMAIDYDTAHGIDFHSSLVAIANAHQGATDGFQYAYYGSPIGRGIVRFFVPDDSPFDTDKFFQVIENSSVENPTKTLADFKSAILQQEYYHLRYIPKLSHIAKTERTKPYPHILYIIAKVKETLYADEQASVIESISRYYQTYNSDMSWLTYASVDNPNELHLMIPVQHFGELNDSYTIKNHLISDDSDIKTHRDKFYQYIDEYRSYVLSHVPNCSNTKITNDE